MQSIQSLFAYQKADNFFMTADFIKWITMRQQIVFTAVLESWMKNTVKYGEDEVQYDAARGRRRVVDGVVAILQCHADRVLETAHVAFKVSQGHVPTCSVIVDDSIILVKSDQL